jgi:hypothetical protein
MKEPVEVDINAKFLHNGYFTTSDSDTDTDAFSATDSDDKVAGVAYDYA